MFRIVISSIMRRRRGLNSAIGGSCLRDGLQHPHPLSQEPLNKSPQSRRASGFVQSRSDSTQAQRAPDHLNSYGYCLTASVRAASKLRIAALRLDKARRSYRSSAANSEIFSSKMLASFSSPSRGFGESMSLVSSTTRGSVREGFPLRTILVD